jgi:hypothetical protein
LTEYESEDNTEGAQTLACTGGACEILWGPKTSGKLK